MKFSLRTFSHLFTKKFFTAPVPEVAPGLSTVEIKEVQNGTEIHLSLYTCRFNIRIYSLVFTKIPHLTGLK